MKSSLLDALIELFHSYLLEHIKSLPDNSRTTALTTDPVVPLSPSVRIFSRDEQFALDTDGQRLLMVLEQLDVIDSHIREIIINKALRAQNKPLSLPELQSLVTKTLLEEDGYYLPSNQLRALSAMRQNTMLH